MGGNLFRCSTGDHFSAATAAFRPQVDYPVSCLDDVQIVLDHNHSITFIPQTMQYFQQLFNIVKVQAGSGLIKYVQRPACGAFGQFLGELDRKSVV